MKNYDVVVIGAGPGGYVAAIKASQLGAKVAIIEKNELGGVCLNWGCIPTKTLLKSAKVYHYIENADFYGIDIENKGSIKINWPKMLKRKNDVVKKLTSGVKVLLDKNGVDTYKGKANIIDKNTIEVNGEKLSTKNLILATGSSPFIPPIEGIKEGLASGYVLTSKEILDLEKIPNELVIIGGGVIGVEFATLFSEFHTKVTIIEKATDILLNMDKDIRNMMLKILKNKNIKIITNANVTKIHTDGVEVELNSKKEIYHADKILASIGTKPNIEGLEKLGLNIVRNAIVTNERLETNVKSVYAIGDVNGKYMLAHVASHEGIIAVENIMGKEAKIDYTKVPSGIYTYPEIASVGLTEEQAKEQGFDVKIGTFPLAANGKALAEGENEGFIKVIADKKYGEVIGVHILSPNATDMISEAVMTMELEGTIYDIAHAIHPHPTFSEIIMEASLFAIDKPIHTIK